MARPEIIAQVHEAKYELQIALFGNKAERLARYESLVQEASAQFKCTKYELKQAINEDYHAWIRENRLPRPRPNPGLFGH